MFRSIHTIHKSSYLEIARHPAYYLLLLGAGLLVFISQKITLFGFSTELNMIRELGVSTLTLWGVLSCILLTHQSVYAELENRCAMTLLAKPVRRSSYFLGKYFGLFRALFLGSLFLTLILILTLWTHEGLGKLQRCEMKGSAGLYLFSSDVPALETLESTSHVLGGAAAGAVLKTAPLSPRDVVWNYFFHVFLTANVWPVLVGCLLAFAQTALVASFALGLATFFPPVVVATGTLAFYLIGHLADLLAGALAHAGPAALIVGQIIRWVLPNFELFNPADHISRGEPVSAIYVALALSYGILYGSVVLGTTSFAFSRRELP